MKSQFDTDNWSVINGLPGQDDMLHFMKYLLSSDLSKTYSRDTLMDEISKEFGIPEEKANADCPNCNTGALYTRLTYLIDDALNGVRRSKGDIFMKRVDVNLYQHINGPRKAINNLNVSNKMVEEAMVSVKILKEFKETPEEIICNLSGKWKDEEIELAINRVFA